jgi:hypothetical protein
MDSGSSGRAWGTGRSHLASAALARRASSTQSLMIGVVRVCETSWSKRSTVAKVVSGARDTWTLVIKNNAGFLIGRVIVYDKKRQIVFCLDHEELEFKVVHAVLSSNDAPQLAPVSCPECGLMVEPTRLPIHLADSHGLNDWIAELGSDPLHAAGALAKPD